MDRLAASRGGPQPYAGRISVRLGVMECGPPLGDQVSRRLDGVVEIAAVVYFKKHDRSVWCAGGVGHAAADGCSSVP